MSEEQVKLLLVEDDSGLASAIRAVLQHKDGTVSFQSTRVSSLQEALEAISNSRFDIILLDLGLPDSSGLETLERVMAKNAEIPILVLTGLADEQTALRALQQGAQDYLIKGEIRVGTLTRAIRYAMERNRIDRARKQAERQLELALEFSRTGIFEWDVGSNRITWTNAQLLGLPAEKTSGQFDGKCVHSDDVAALMASIQKAIDRHEEWRQEFRIIWPDGSEHWLEGRGTASYNELGMPLRMLGMIIDISQRKNDEETAHLREAEIAHLSRVSMMGQMASGLAHELNQPLGAILNYAGVCIEAMESGKTDAKLMREAVGELMKETRRAGLIISRLRTFVRKQEPHRGRMDVNAVVSESLKILEFELRHQGIRPKLKLEKDLPAARADAVQIQQVLVNLIYNAMEAMAEVGPDITTPKQLLLETLRGGVPGTVEISVLDTGPGIAPEHLEHLFQPFFTTKKQGMGMGLNISRTIVESHGGRLSAASTVGNGTRFSFTLPTDEGEQI